MSAELISALFVFAFVASVTPGPNNLMLMASGANFGFRRTTPHMFGIAVGFNVMVVLLRMGLMGVFDAFPAMRQVLKVVSVAYLLWLAWKIANAAAPGRNLMLMASGANFGFRRTTPHMFGIAVGFNVMVVLLRMGLMGVFDAFPAMRQVLKVVSVAYLLWLAWKIANAAAPKPAASR